jgi:hypothetical protein
VVVFDECETDCIGALTLRWCFSKSPGAMMMKPPRNGAGLAAPKQSSRKHHSTPTSFYLVARPPVERGDICQMSSCTAIAFASAGSATGFMLDL